MKKCPSCQKTYDDHLKFCQKDGTALVTVAEEAPVDPYKTMVASNIAPPEPAAPEKPAAESEDAPEAAPVAEAEAVEEVPVNAREIPLVDESEGDVLEIPSEKPEVDPMKTIAVRGKSTSDNIKVPDLPEPAGEESPEPTPEAADTASEESEAATMINPELPKFSEPLIEPPDLSGNLPSEPVAPEAPSAPATPAETDVSDKLADSKPSLPIPSPFEESMPPGYSVPDTPPFEHPLGHKPESESKPAPPPASPFTDPVAPEAASGSDDWDIGSGNLQDPGPGTDLDAFADNKISEPSLSDASVEGANKTLAFISLGTGVLSILCCVGGILIGPIAIFTGFMAKNKIKADPSVYGGGTFATFGMIMGVLGAILSVIVILLNVFTTMMNTGAF